MSLGRLRTEGDLARFMERKLEEPGLVNVGNLAGVLDVADLGGLGYGQGTLTFTASNTATVTIAHPFDGEPAMIGLCPDNGAIGQLVNLSAGNLTDTDFDVTGRTIDGSTPTGSVTVYWIGVG